MEEDHYSKIVKKMLNTRLMLAGGGGAGVGGGGGERGNPLSGAPPLPSLTPVSASQNADQAWATQSYLASLSQVYPALAAAASAPNSNYPPSSASSLPRSHSQSHLPQHPFLRASAQQQQQLQQLMYAQQGHSNNLNTLQSFNARMNLNHGPHPSSSAPLPASLPPALRKALMEQHQLQQYDPALHGLASARDFSLHGSYAQQNPHFPANPMNFHNSHNSGAYAVPSRPPSRNQYPGGMLPNSAALQQRPKPPSPAPHMHSLGVLAEKILAGSHSANPNPNPTNNAIMGLSPLQEQFLREDLSQAVLGNLPIDSAKLLKLANALLSPPVPSSRAPPHSSSAPPHSLASLLANASPHTPPVQHNASPHQTAVAQRSVSLPPSLLPPPSISSSPLTQTTQHSPYSNAEPKSRFDLPEVSSVDNRRSATPNPLPPPSSLSQPPSLRPTTPVTSSGLPLALSSSSSQSSSVAMSSLALASSQHVYSIEELRKRLAIAESELENAKAKGESYEHFDSLEKMICELEEGVKIREAKRLKKMLSSSSNSTSTSSAAPPLPPSPSPSLSPPTSFNSDPNDPRWLTTIQKDESWYRHIFLYSEAPQHILTTALCYVDVNFAFCEQAGLPREHFLRNNVQYADISKILDQPNPLFDMIRRAVKGEIVEIKDTHVLRNGRKLSVNGYMFCYFTEVNGKLQPVYLHRIDCTWQYE